MNRVAIILHTEDDVATALTALQAGQDIHASLEAVEYQTTLLEDIEFGHKYALHDIQQGEPILKYGLPIGNALQNIKAGEWVHVHNCRSEHFGYRREQYGLQA